MKTIPEINQEIEKLSNQPAEEMTKGEYSRLQTKLRFLRECIMYLEKEPRLEFVKAEKEKLEARKVKIKASYPEFLANNQEAKFKTNPESYFNQQMGIPAINKHIDNLNYILG